MRTRRVLGLAALVALATSLPGCMFALGSTLPSDADRRVERLEERVKKAEERLGIPTPAGDR